MLGMTNVTSDNTFYHILCLINVLKVVLERLLNRIVILFLNQ